MRRRPWHHCPHMRRGAGGKSAGHVSSAHGGYLMLFPGPRRCPQASMDRDKWASWSASCLPRGDLQTTFVFKGFDEVSPHE